MEILDARGISSCVAALRRGELVIFPTETVYGLGARALDADAVARIFRAKGRPNTHPLIVHVADVEQARSLVGAWPASADQFAAAFWPGPLALIVARGEAIPEIVTGGGPTVAIRCPAHPLALALIRALKEPIAAPSANLYQSLSPTRVGHIAPELAAQVAYALDGGACERGIESTVLDLTGERPKVLRPGAISLEMLRAIDPNVVGSTIDAPVDRLSPDTGDRGREADDSVHRSPGQDVRHYAPKTPLVIVSRAAIEEAVRADFNVAIVHHSRREALLSPSYSVRSETRFFSMPSDPEGYAYMLFAALHDADNARVSRIVVEEPPLGDRWAGVLDRLMRAATSVS